MLDMDTLTFFYLTLEMQAFRRIRLGPKIIKKTKQKKIIIFKMYGKKVLNFAQLNNIMHFFQKRINHKKKFKKKNNLFCFIKV